MRLIDADELEMKVVHRDTDGWGPQYGVFAYQLREAPTIDAIPVDWLRERASRMLDFGEGIERIIQEWQDEQSK